MILSPIDSAHLIWPHLEASLQRVKDKTGDRWSTNFVLSKIQSGNAGLFRFHDRGTHIAYAVVERYDQGEKPWMNVWILEGDIGAPRARDVVQCLDELAKSVGAKVWRFTGRKGWGKALGEMVKPIATVYEREIL